MAKKNYVLDTNVLIYEPNALFMFEDNDLFISPVTLRELNNLKTRDGEAGYSARRARNILEDLRNGKGNIRDGIPLGEDLGRLYVITDVDFSGFQPGMSRNENDDYILAAAAFLGTHSEIPTILVTDDVDMRLLGDIIGIQSEPFRGKRSKVELPEYLGRGSLEITHTDMEKLLAGKIVAVPKNAEVEVNEFLELTDKKTGRFLYGKTDGNTISPLEYLTDGDGNDIHPYDAVARNNGQKFAQEALLTPASKIPLVIIKGPAGTAKTFMTLACALEQTQDRPYDCGRYDRILITRANVEMDNTYGFLPGSEEEKIGPMMRPFMDNLNALVRSRDVTGARYTKDGLNCPDAADYLFDRGVIKAEAMQYMRGRSIKDTFVIIDEVQNCTPNQILSIVSRIGEGSKIVLLGDPEQIDNKFLNKRNNGLVFASERFRGSKLCAQISMKQSECVRSPLAAEAAVRLAHDYGRKE